MTRIVVTGSYKKPREGNWYIGVFLLLTALGLLYTGTVLKWDQEGFEALLHAEELAKSLGILGIPLTSDFAPSTTLLSRIYGIHVSLLPIIGVLLIGGHLVLIKLHGISPLPGDEETWEKDTDQTFVDHLKMATIHSLVFFVFLSVLAILLPQKARPAPIIGIETARPPWAFLPWFPLENYMGLFSLVVFPTILILFFLAIPLIDRNPDRDPRKGVQKIVVWSMIAIFVLVLILNILSAILTPEQHV